MKMSTTLTAQKPGTSHEESSSENNQGYISLDGGVPHSGSVLTASPTIRRQIPGPAFLDTALEGDFLRSGCGCIHVPDILHRLLDRKKGIFCPAHGWQKPWRKASSKEVTNHLLGLPLDYEPELPDTPPF
jgi:hypothetical protein